MSAEQDQDTFVFRRQEDWTELEKLLGLGKELHRGHPREISRAASLYRSVCADLMRARSRFGPDLVRYLDGLAARAHNLLYGSRAYRISALWELIAHEFPRTIRQRWGFFLLANLLFYVPFFIGMFGTLASTEFAQTILPAEQLAGMEDMYQQGFDEGRDGGQDSAMAGFYVLNNVGIAFRCFATGILFGLGSLFFSIYNGLTIGVVLGWVTSVGHGGNILTFICGHGPFELTAIVISAGAGLQMGWALIKTDGLTRTGSLRAQSRELGNLIVGAAVMLVIAAGIEGFWSPSSMPPPVKWAFSGFACLFVTAWLALGGRTRTARAPTSEGASG